MTLLATASVLAVWVGSTGAAQRSDAPITGRYEATSGTASAVTGNLTITATAVRGALGVRATLSPTVIPVLARARTSRRGDTFASLLGVPGSTRVQVRRVTAERVTAAARNGGFCGKGSKTRFLAMALDNEGDFLGVAAFTGSVRPGAKTRASQTTLCGTYNYTFVP